MAKKKKPTPTGERDVSAIPPQPQVARPPPDPKFIWPPFPIPPDGVTIIPFSKFEPKGIKVSFDDEPEKDGEGLSTIPLLVKHGLLGHRKSKNKKKKNPLAEIGEEELKKMTWDKRWELGEELRTAKPLDHYDPLVDRFIESTRLFHNGRPWDRPRQELWDQFRLYAGVISGVKRPHSKKKSRFVDDEGPKGPQSGPEDDTSDEDLMVVDGDPVTVSDEESPNLDAEEEKRNARNEEAYQQFLAAREERPHFWVEETEKAVKVFLSSHFRDKGLMWSEPGARDMPILIRMYLEFVLKHKLFVEKDFNRGYEKALVIAKRAELDLTATFTMSRAFPDEWGLACKSFWGQLYYTAFEEYFRNQSKNQTWAGAAKPPEGGDRSETLVDDTDQSKLVAVDYDLGEQRIKEEAPKILPPLEEPISEEATVEVVDEDEGAPIADTVELSTFTVEDKAAPKIAATHQDADDGGWGPSSDNVSTADLAHEWDLPKGNPEEEEDVWGTFVEPTLFSFIGPSEFPARRIPIRAEKSTRVLVAVLPPDPASTSIVASRLATLVLQPWPTPDDDPDSLVTSPQMVDFWKGDQEKQDLKAESVKLARDFDPTKDEIRVHVAPEVVGSCRLGMGIGAIWVQVGRRADIGDVSKPTKRKKYPGDDWWYMERLEFVIPSYWTVSEAHRDMTRAGNNPEYAYDSSD